jgi:hypothetical protein
MMTIRPIAPALPPLPRRLRPLGAGILLAALLVPSTLHAAEQQPKAWADGWSLSTQAPYGFNSGGAPGSYFFHGAPATGFTASNGSRGFYDVGVGRSLGFGRELGLDSMRATFGARMAAPPAGSGIAPTVDNRRYVGVGPRLGLDGSKQLPLSWSLEWQVGAAMLFGDRSAGADGVAPLVPNYAAGNGGVVNVDGLLGLSYWFDAASKLTLGYRADAYFKGSPSFSAGLPAAQNADRLDHGPVVRFTIQK